MSVAQPLTSSTNASQASAQDESSTSLGRYWPPKYWPTWLFLAWLRLTAALPWGLAIRMHKAIGRGLWSVLARRRLIVERNLELCFPELEHPAIEVLAKRNFENICACIAELAMSWFASPQRLKKLYRIEGREHIDAAVGKGKGVILMSGHFTTLEICVPVIKSIVPFFAFMFSPRRNPLLNAMQVACRRRAAHASFPDSNVRAMVRMLRNKGVVWYAPDQASSGKSGELLEFFGEPAMTNTAASRLARVSGATVVPFFFRRLEDESGYVLRFEPALEDIPGDDSTKDTMRMIRVIEDFVRECPEQYFWNHRKFRSRPSELPMAYADVSTVAEAGSLAKGEPRASALGKFVAPLAAGIVALFIVGVLNRPFWEAVLSNTTGNEHRIAIVVSMFAILFCTTTIVMSLMLNARLFKITGACLLILAAACSYFMTEHGVVFDAAFMRDIADAPIRDAAPLVTAAFFAHVLGYGVFPALLLVLVPWAQTGLRPALTARLVTIAACAAVLTGTLYANYGAVSLFDREHGSVRMLANPGYPIYAYARYLLGADETPPVPPTP